MIEISEPSDLARRRIQSQIVAMTPASMSDGGAGGEESVLELVAHPDADAGPARSCRPDVPDETVSGWQYIVDAVTERLGVPVGLIMRVVGPEIEVLVANGDERNPHAVGERASLAGSGMYCERVLATGGMLCVANAHAEAAAWAGNPCFERHGLSSYLGFPIRWPDGATFGTLCVLQRGERAYSRHDREVLELMRDLIESSLHALYPA